MEPVSDAELRLSRLESGPIPEERFDEVIAHLRDSFFADEPLNRSVSLCARGQPHRELEEHARATLRDGLSEMVLDAATDRVVGVALNGVLLPDDLSASQAKLAEMDDAKFRRIFGLLYSVNRRLDLFTKYGVDRIFECRILSVDNRYRGRGLARQLLERSIETARAAGFQLVKEDATGLFSQRAAESMGFQTVCELPYEEYTDEAGRVVFPIEAPHKSLKIMVKELR
ncbi:Dopamine N-acetyltransferase [Frankliniella fusca]|uniref:aralkylamine N-acetyltransferase n=1 Tax=Frankliniella fusca TaxID=407009 RepID=A0AAE1H1J5_9NEOP|nr:Dopamine N-acetyltransferase [Frankliniella fusca]